MINWKVRFKNPLFWLQLVMSIIMPILAYYGLAIKDINSWVILGDTFVKAVSNPYVLGLVIVSVYNSVVDPTTTGFADSRQALTYDKPNGDKG